MKYKVILIILGISLAISVVLGTSYAIWLLTDTQVDDNVVEAGCFDVSFTGNTDGISLLNSYPVPDSVGSQNTPFNFTVTNTCDLDAYYDINVEVLDTTTLDSSLIKVKLDSNNPLIVTDGEAKPATISGASAYKIGEGYLEPGDAGTHDFRMWMDYSATLDNSQNAVIYTKIVINTSPVDTDIIDTSVCLGDYENRRLTPTPVSDLTYTETDTEVTITGYTNNQEMDIIIPCEINGKPVTVIGSGAFQMWGITSLVLPIGLRDIQDSAFRSQNLLNLTIPEGVQKIGNYAFQSNDYRNGMKTLVLPDSLVSIGNYAFASNFIENVIIPDKVETIGTNAFQFNPIENLILGDSLEYIGYGSFDRCNIKSLVIPSSVRIIDAYAFDGNDFSSLIIGEYVNEIGIRAFSNITTLTEITIPKSVIRIGENAFHLTPLTVINIEGKTRFEDFALLGNPWYEGTPTINWIP